MSETSTPTLSARDDRHRRVTEAVRALIAEQGFRLSMEAVAARAGCSKQTLYSNYGSKQALLRQVIVDRVKSATANLVQAKDNLRSTLADFAAAHLEHLFDPSTFAARQLFFAEAHRFADDATLLFRDAAIGLQKQVSACLASAMQRGQLRESDPDNAAELLLAMIVGIDLDRRHFAVAHRDSAKTRRDWAEFAVDQFLRAFAPLDSSP